MSKLVPFRSVLIFGGAGFIGSNWARRLLETTDAKVHLFDNLSRPGVHRNLEWLKATTNDGERLKITVGDVRDASLVERAVQSATEIYHFAAQVAVTTSITDPVADFDVNARGTLNILEAARKTGRHPFLLFTSTNKVYGCMASRSVMLSGNRYSCPEQPSVDETQPLDFCSPYGCSKGAAEQYVHDYSKTYGLPTVVFRMSCIAGAHQCGNEDQGWVAHFLYSALQSQPITIYGDGLQVRDVLCVDDLARAFESVRKHVGTTAGEVYNVGGGLGNAVSLVEVIEQVGALTGKDIRFRFEKARTGDQLYYVSDTRKLQRHTGWGPQIGTAQTLETIYRWWKQEKQVFVPEAAVNDVPIVLSEAPGLL